MQVHTDSLWHHTRPDVWLCKTSPHLPPPHPYYQAEHPLEKPCAFSMNIIIQPSQGSHSITHGLTQGSSLGPTLQLRFFPMEQVCPEITRATEGYWTELSLSRLAAMGAQRMS